MSTPTELVLAAATGSDGGLGVIGTVPASTGVVYVRCDCADTRVGMIEWNVKCNRANTVQLYRARSIVQSVTLDISAGTLANTETIIVNGLTFTAHTDTNVRATRQFAIDGNATADGVELAAAINYGNYLTVTACDVGETLTVEGLTYTAAAAEDLSGRAFTRTNAATAAASIARCINRDTATTGVTAAVSDGAEVVLTKSGLTITATTAAPGTHITIGNYGVPGVLAVPVAGVVTLTPLTANPAPVIQAVTGTAAGKCVVASTTLTGLIRDGAATAVAADTTSGGQFYSQYVNGWPYAYLGLTNTDAGGAATVTVKATRHIG